MTLGDIRAGEGLEDHLIELARPASLLRRPAKTTALLLWVYVHRQATCRDHRMKSVARKRDFRSVTMD